MVLKLYSALQLFLLHAFFCSEVGALLWEILFSSSVEKMPVRVIY